MCSVRSSPDGSASSSRCSLGGRICSAPGSPSRSRSQRATSSARWPSERPTLKSLVRKTSEAGGDGHSAQRHAVPSRSPLQNRQQKRGVMTVGGAPTYTVKWKFRNAPCSCSLPHLGGPTLTGPAGVIRTCSCGGGGTCALAGRTDSAALSASKTANLRIAPPFARGWNGLHLPHWEGRAQLHYRPVSRGSSVPSGGFRPESAAGVAAVSGG